MPKKFAFRCLHLERKKKKKLLMLVLECDMSTEPSNIVVPSLKWSAGVGRST